MARRKGRNNKPPVIPWKHHPDCVCGRCLEDDTKKLENALEDAWEKHNQEVGTPANIHLTVRDSPVIGPFVGEDTTKACSVACPMAIVGHIAPKGRRRK